MVSVLGWWSKRSRAERFDISLRWPLYFVVACAPLIAVMLVLSDSRPTSTIRAALFLLVSAAHGVVGVKLMRATLNAYLHRPGPSARLLITAVTLTAAGVVLLPDHGVALLLLGGMLTLALSPLPPMIALLGLVVLGAVVAGLLGGPQGAFSTSMASALRLSAAGSLPGC